MCCDVCRNYFSAASGKKLNLETETVTIMAGIAIERMGTMEVFIWLGILVVCLVIEAITVGLTTIWFAAGAFVAMVASALGLGILGQLILFFLVSLFLLFVTRPIAVRYVNPNKIRTNYEGAVGKTVKITERVDNRNETGKAVLNGQEWTARMWGDADELPEGEIAKVAAVEGVKLMLVPFVIETDGKRKEQ